MNIYRRNYRPIDYIIPAQEKQISQAHIIELQKMLSNELKSLAMYLQASFSIARNDYSVNYYGCSRDMQQQLICHAIHEMGHVEAIGRILFKLGHSPQLMTSKFDQPKTYKELFTIISQCEKNKIKDLLEVSGTIHDQEIKGTLINQLREENSHLQMISKVCEELERVGIIDALLSLPEGVGPVSYDIRILLDALETEIHSIVTLMYGSILSGMDMTVSLRLRSIAIEDMQHLNEIAQDIITLGGRPAITHEYLNITSMLNDTTRCIKHTIKIKQNKIKQYTLYSHLLKSNCAAKTLANITEKELESIAELRGFTNTLEKAEPIH